MDVVLPNNDSRLLTCEAKKDSSLLTVKRDNVHLSDVLSDHSCQLCQETLAPLVQLFIANADGSMVSTLGCLPLQQYS